jgi:hypothetical protein
MNDEERADDFPTIEQSRLDAGHPPTGLKWLRYDVGRRWGPLKPLTEQENLLADCVERQAEEIKRLKANAENVTRLRLAAQYVVSFDWSDNDDDAVQAIDDLRSVLE